MHTYIDRVSHLYLSFPPSFSPFLLPFFHTLLNFLNYSESLILIMSSTVSSKSSLTDDAKSIDFSWTKSMQLSNYPWAVKNSDKEIDRQLVQHWTLKIVQKGFFTAPPEVHEALLRGSEVLDIGTGPGMWALEMASEYPKLEVLGVDIEDSFPSEVMPRNCNFEIVDARQPLPYEDNRFDFVHQRLISVGFKRDEWVPVLKEVRRVLKKGSWLVMLEPMMIIEHQGPTGKRVWAEIIRALESRDTDPHPALNIRHYAAQAGLVDISEVVYSLPLGKWAGIAGDLFREDIVQTIRNFRPYIISNLNDLSSDEAFEKVIKEIESEWEGNKAYMNVHTIAAKK